MTIRVPPAEALVAVTFALILSCAVQPPPASYEGEVVEVRRSMDRDGEPQVQITVGYRSRADYYEQATGFFPLYGHEGLLFKEAGQCVRVTPYGRQVRLAPCR